MSVTKCLGKVRLRNSARLDPAGVVVRVLLLPCIQIAVSHASGSLAEGQSARVVLAMSEEKNLGVLCCTTSVAFAQSSTTSTLRLL